MAFGIEIEVTPRMLGDGSWVPCRDDPQRALQGSIFIEVVGRPGALTDHEIQLLENGFISTYNAVTSETCLVGYRRILAAKIDPTSIPLSTALETFQLQMKNVYGVCEGCSSDQRFFEVINGGKMIGRRLESKLKSVGRRLHRRIIQHPPWYESGIGIASSQYQADGSKTGNGGSKTAKGGNKEAKGRSKGGKGESKGGKGGSKGGKGGSNAVEGGSNVVKGGSKSAQGGSKAAQRGSKAAQRGSKAANSGVNAISGLTKKNAKKKSKGLPSPKNCICPPPSQRIVTTSFDGFVANLIQSGLIVNIQSVKLIGSVRPSMPGVAPPPTRPSSPQGQPFASTPTILDKWLLVGTERNGGNNRPSPGTTTGPTPTIFEYKPSKPIASPVTSPAPTMASGSAPSPVNPSVPTTQPVQSLPTVTAAPSPSLATSGPAPSPVNPSIPTTQPVPSLPTVTVAPSPSLATAAPSQLKVPTIPSTTLVPTPSQPIVAPPQMNPTIPPAATSTPFAGMPTSSPANSMPNSPLSTPAPTTSSVSRPPSAAVTSQPTIAATFPTASPTKTLSPTRTMQPSVSCSLTTAQCCVNADCMANVEVCVLQRCIKQGHFRFTLSWIGNDDLDLYVRTPGGFILRPGNVFDPVSGGMIGQNTNQLYYGMWVENTYFPATAPPGVYTFYVVPFIIRGTPDTWTLAVYVDGMQVQVHQGTGMSPMFTVTIP